MSQVVIALVGISGVGKSTLLRNLAKTFAFQHLQASSLIKDARAALSQTSVSSDALRLANIEENQRLLIAGFERSRDKTISIVVLDGHTVIDAPTGLQNIEPQVFEAIGVTQFIFLADDPSKIIVRRSGDVERKRPSRTAAELQNHQNIALLNTLKASLLMSVPIVVVSPDQFSLVDHLFRLLLPHIDT